MIRFFVTLVIILMTAIAQADDVIYDGPSDWTLFDQFMKKQEEEDQIKGLSYLVSGTLATVGGSIGYYESSDTFSRGAYALTQSLGILAIGYGASIYWTGNEFGSFYTAVKDSNLTNAQRNELLARFLKAEQIRYERDQAIRMSTHFLLAAVNFYASTRETDKDVKKLFQFLGGINLFLALTYAF